LRCLVQRVARPDAHVQLAFGDQREYLTSALAQ